MAVITSDSYLRRPASLDLLSVCNRSTTDSSQEQINLLAGANADILILQEIDPNARRTHRSAARLEVLSIGA